MGTLKANTAAVNIKTLMFNVPC